MFPHCLDQNSKIFIEFRSYEKSKVMAAMASAVQILFAAVLSKWDGTNP